MVEPASLNLHVNASEHPAPRHPAKDDVALGVAVSLISVPFT
jgi:hypothetical protein